jgi:hypothetical protein
MTAIDATALEALGHSVVLPAAHDPGAGAALQFSNLGRLRLTASANILAEHPAPVSPTQTVTVQHSDDGTSWSTLSTFSFTDDGDTSAIVEKPKAYLRISWAVGTGTWAPPVVEAQPLASTLPSLTEASGLVTLAAVLALTAQAAPATPAAGWVVWADADGNVYAKDHIGTVITLAAHA